MPHRGHEPASSMISIMRPSGHGAQPALRTAHIQGQGGEGFHRSHLPDGHQPTDGARLHARHPRCVNLGCNAPFGLRRSDTWLATAVRSPARSHYELRCGPPPRDRHRDATPWHGLAEADQQRHWGRRWAFLPTGRGIAGRSTNPKPNHESGRYSDQAKKI